MTSRAELLSLLRTYIQISPTYWREIEAEGLNGDPVELGGIDQRFFRIANANVEVVGDISLLRDAIGALSSSDEFLASLADELTSLLKEALDHWAIVGEANEQLDPSYYHQPSILPHDQNPGPENWTFLIDLLWRAWTHIDSVSPAESRRLVERWRAIQYPIFKRMVLQALSQSSHWTIAEKLEVLLHGTS